MIVLGVDVGIRACGYVICGVKNLNIDIVREGQIEPDPAKSTPERLNHIYDVLESEIDAYAPEAMIVEKLYSHHKHPTTLGVLAQVRGVAALLAYKKKLKFFEYSPTRARKSFLGKGRGNSEQVKKMAENITRRQFMSLHTADAYSLVVAFSHAQKVVSLLPDYFSHDAVKTKKFYLNNAVSNSWSPGKKRRASSHP